MNISEKLQTIAANEPQVYNAGQLSVLRSSERLSGSASGEVVQIKDISPIPHTMDVKVEPTNLIPFPYYNNGTTTYNGITYTVNSDKSITVTGTATANSLLVLTDMSQALHLTQGKQYTLSGYVSGSGCTVRFCDSMYRQIITLRVQAEEQTFITAYESTANYMLNIIVAEGATVNATIKPKLAAEIADITEVNVKACGKNLLNVPENLTWTGVYTVNTYLPAGTYHITYSGETHEGTDVPTLRLGTKSYNVGRKEWIVTLTAPQTVIYLYTNGFNANASKGVSATVNQWMISLDGGDYEAYKAPTEYTPNADGTVEGIKSVYPTTTLMTDTEYLNIDCNYYKDIDKAFAEALNEQAIDIAVSGGE